MECGDLFRLIPVTACRGEATLVFMNLLRKYHVELSFGLFLRETQVNPIGIMDQAAQDRISNGWISNVPMSIVNGQSTGNDGRGMTMPILDDLQEIPSFRVCHGSQSEVIEHEEMDFAELRHDSSVTAISFCQCEVIIELGGTEIEGPVALTASFVSKSTSEEGFADCSGACDDDALVLFDPIARAKTHHNGSVDPSRVLVADVFETGIVLQFSLFE
jgi:hypothetical protein